MAVLVATGAQKEALQEINAKLTEIKGLDALLSAENLNISCSKGNRTISSKVDDEDRKATCQILAKKKSRLVKRVLFLANKFGIDFSKNEREILGIGEALDA